MLPPFSIVVEYRRYRLSNTEAVPHGNELRSLYKLKKQIDGLYPTLGAFDGANPIQLLGFLKTLKEAFETYTTSEAVAVRALAYFLTDEAKDVYHAQVNPGAVTGHAALEATWPYVINAVIRRLLADDILQSAYHAVVRASKGADEDEAKFAQRIAEAARECCHVFQPMELVNSYIRGLHEATRERIQEQVRRLPHKERASLNMVRQLASAEGRAQRAQLRSKPASNNRPPNVARPHARHYLLLLNPNSSRTAINHGSTSPPSTPNSTSYYEWDDQNPVPIETLQPADPVSIVDAAVTLENIFMVTSATKETLSEYNLDGRNVQHPTKEIPELTDEQIGQPLAVVPTDYWQLSCWSCRDGGHSTFTCPKLTVKQRIFFAFRYYRHQDKNNPILTEWHNQKRRALQGGPEPGPRPSDKGDNTRAYGRGRGNNSQKRVLPIDEPNVIDTTASQPAPPSFVGPGIPDEEDE